MQFERFFCLLSRSGDNKRLSAMGITLNALKNGRKENRTCSSASLGEKANTFDRFDRDVRLISPMRSKSLNARLTVLTDTPTARARYVRPGKTFLQEFDNPKR